EYAAQRRALITGTASHALRPGTVPGRPTPPVPVLRTQYASTAPPGSLPGAPAGDAAAGVGEPTVPAATALAPPASTEPDSPEHTGATRGDTCHIDVVDRWGNMVSATPSGGWLQSSP